MEDAMTDHTGQWFEDPDDMRALIAFNDMWQAQADYDDALESLALAKSWVESRRAAASAAERYYRSKYCPGNSKKNALRCSDGRRDD